MLIVCMCVSLSELDIGTNVHWIELGDLGAGRESAFGRWRIERCSEVAVGHMLVVYGVVQGSAGSYSIQNAMPLSLTRYSCGCRFAIR